MLYLTEHDVKNLLPFSKAIELMRTAFEMLASGTAMNQPRRRLFMPSKAVLHYMVAGDARYFGTKIYSTHPQHGAYFLVLLYRTEDGAPVALIEANHLGKIRTGATSALAVSLLAPESAGILAILGSGFQARGQLAAILEVRDIKSVRVWSPTPEHRQRFAEEMSERYHVKVQAASTAEEAVRGADIVVTATSARDPILRYEWLDPHAVVVAIGSNHPARCELEGEILRKADLVVVDSLEQAEHESGDLLRVGDPERWAELMKIVELKDLVARRVTPGKHLNVFKSHGLAIEDVIAAGYVYEKALERKQGQHLPIFSS